MNPKNLDFLLKFWLDRHSIGDRLRYFRGDGCLLTGKNARPLYRPYRINKNSLPKSSQSIVIFSYIFISIVVFLSFNPTVRAQDAIEPISNYQTNSEQANTIYVNAETGKDEGNSGNERSPLKTITQALKIAQSQTVILLAPGKYSEQTGETFPLIVKENVSIQGSQGDRGNRVLIEGSGYYVSPTAAGQYVTIVATRDAAALSGVTVSNPQSRGHGLWIESASPQVSNSTFTRNGNSGVSVNGNSAPTIINNYFYNNAGNGLLIYGTSKAQVEKNQFDRTGFGVSILENSVATLKNNRISNNRIGVILEANGVAILRNNAIEYCRESGLMAIARSSVDLGTEKEPGGNVFRSNGKVDIHNAGKGQVVAFGNQLSGNTSGNVDLAGSIISLHPAKTNSSSSIDRDSPLPSLLNPRESSSTNTSNQKEFVFNASHNNAKSTNTNNRSNLLPLPPIVTTRTAKASAETISYRNATRDRTEITSSPSNTAIVKNSSQPEVQLETLPPPPVIQTPEAENNDDLVSQASGNNHLLPVPDMPVPQSKLTKVSTNSSRVVGYRVMVEADNHTQQSQIRSLYPDAFNTVYQGRSMMQVGVFSSRNKADTILDSLKNMGLMGIVTKI